MRTFAHGDTHVSVTRKSGNLGSDSTLSRGQQTVAPHHGSLILEMRLAETDSPPSEKGRVEEAEALRFLESRLHV